MTSKTISKGILRAVFIIIGIALLLYFLYKIQSVLAYLTIAAVIALMGRPVVLFLRRKLKFPNTLAVVVTMLVMVGLLAGVLALFVPLLTEQGKNLSLLDIDDLQSQVENLYREITGFLGLSPFDIEESIKESKIFANLDFRFIPNFLNSVLGTLGDLSIGLFSVLFISFFFLKDSKLFQTRKGVL